MAEVVWLGGKEAEIKCKKEIIQTGSKKSH